MIADMADMNGFRKKIAKRIARSIVLNALPGENCHFDLNKTYGPIRAKEILRFHECEANREADFK
ncbi:unnamed protein product [marine sediment metagenome]|uniref:Uncharacterized protein n=1 Tax=marine sediment metagenome TaxID=412755 RepID=X1GNN1_9ZZZZ